MTKRIPKEVKNKIKKEYELGIDLIDLAIKYGVNYGTLRHIASRKKWQKNRVVDLTWIKEVERLSEELLIKREKKKKEYQSLTQNLIKDLKSIEKLDDYNYVVSEEENKSFAESKANVLKLRASAIKELYLVDKELFNLLTPEEELELQTKAVKLEELKRKLNITNEDENETIENNNDIQEARNMLLKAKGVKR